MIIYCKHIRRLGISGISIFPFIIMAEKDLTKRGTVMINHERIHHKQQEEVLVFCLPIIAWLALTVSPWCWLLVPVNPFYFWYGIEYLVHRIRLRHHQAAYLAISFELEAYGWQFDEFHLKKRETFFWVKYL